MPSEFPRWRTWKAELPRCLTRMADWLRRCLVRRWNLLHLVNAAVVAQVVYASGISGGIFSVHQTWLSILPLMSLYLMGRSAALFWFLITVLTQTSLAYVTWKGHLPLFPLGTAQLFSALISNVSVTFLALLVSLAYDGLNRHAMQDERQRTKTLETKQAELLAVMQQRDRFIASVSHELRTPMNAILGFNGLLLFRHRDHPQLKPLLYQIQQSADHLLTVINDVLDYSQMQSGHLRIRPQTCELREVVQSAFALFSPRVRNLKLIYECDIADDVPQWVEVDRHRLIQILVNLLGNAIKFTHAGHVRLRVIRQGQGVRFEITDSGIGIPQTQQANLFQRFAQGASQTQNRYGGNGLGLAITRQLVQLLRGAIGFHSVEGQGSCFWFFLPLQAVEPPNASKTTLDAVSALTGKAEPWRFLVVDDHATNRLLLRQVLGHHWKNAEFIEAHNGKEALQALEAQRFDLVLMDMLMPEMDGIEATRHLRMSTDAATRNVPVLGITANISSQDLDRFVAAGVDALVLKPFDARPLCEEIEQLLKRFGSLPAGL